jgi:GGDEF domain-containing protein
MGSPGKSDFVDRYAGDELSIILMDTAAREGMGLADRFSRVVSTLFINHGYTAQMSLFMRRRGGNRVK